MTLTLVNGQLSARAQWLAARRTGLGASDAGPICGYSPYKDAWTLYQEKLGNVEEEELDPLDVRCIGTLMEPVIAELYTRKTGVTLLPAEPFKITRHPSIEWMFATLDREAVGGSRCVELKNVTWAKGWGPDGTDILPKDVYVQTQHQMAVSGFPRCDVCALIRGSEVRVYPILRSESIIESIIELEEEFWYRVQHRWPPDPETWRKRTQDAIKQVCRPDGEVVSLADEEYLQMVNDWHWYHQQRLVSEKKEKELRASLTVAMGNASVAEFADGTVIERPMRKAVFVKAHERKAHARFEVKRPPGAQVLPPKPQTGEERTEEFLARLYDREDD